MSQTHPLKAIFDENSKILILGSFPSVVSRKFGFYYANPQNRFWRVLAQILNSPPPVSTEEKIKFLLTRGIAIYDAAICCEIKSSSDAKMTAVVPANLEPIFSGARIVQVIRKWRQGARNLRKIPKNSNFKRNGQRARQAAVHEPCECKF